MTNLNLNYNFNTEREERLMELDELMFKVDVIFYNNKIENSKLHKGYKKYIDCLINDIEFSNRKDLNQLSFVELTDKSVKQLRTLMTQIEILASYL